MQLFDHQKEGIAFMKEKKRAILADEMGLGKTRQAIVAAGQKSDKGMIIICPASLKINWKREIRMVYPEDGVHIVESGPEKFLPDMPWIIINYDLLEKYASQIRRLFDIGQTGTVIIDEAHYIKDTKTIRAQNTLAIADMAERVYCLTGTPVMNRPIELFSLLKAVKHPLAYREDVAPSKLKREYSVRYCDGKIRTIMRRGGKVLRFWEESGASRLAELKELTKGVFLRRTKAEVLDLPEKIISVVPVSLDDAWQKEYDTAWEQYLDFIAKNPLKKDLENIIGAQSLVELIKLKQVCSKSKIPRIIDDIENAVEQGQKVIVFSQFTGTIEDIASGLRKKKIGTVTLTGENDMDERQAAVDGFQGESDIMAFVANIKAGGIGLNLTAASIVIFADMDWSPEIHRQAEDRAHRIGQKGTVNVYYYVLEKTIEDDILDILTKKQETIGTLTGGDTTIKAFLELVIRRSELSTKTLA